MKRILRRFTSSLILLTCLAGCGTATSQEQRLALTRILQRDATVIQDRTAPDEIIPDLASYTVIALGEGRHHIPAYEEAITHLTLALQPSGVRQLLLEMPHAFDAEVNAYVLGEADVIEDFVKQHYGPQLDTVRDFNAQRPIDERISVRAIDINHDLGLYTYMLNKLAPDLESGKDLPEILEPVLGEYANGANLVNVTEVYTALNADAARYTTAWGERRYQQILEMTEVQMRSIPVKAKWESAYAQAHVEREEIIKDLVDRRLGDLEGHKTVLHMGGNHIQHEHEMGTKKEWVGGYLANRSPIAAGHTLLLYVTALEGTFQNNGKVQSFNVRTGERRNELLRVLATEIEQPLPPDGMIYLPLADPCFTEQAMPVNYSGQTITHKPKAQFDAFLVLPCAMCETD